MGLFSITVKEALMLFRFLTVLGLCLPIQAVAQVSDFMLDNGMQVVVIEDHRAPVVVQMVWYKVGAADEGTRKIRHRSLFRAFNV